MDAALGIEEGEDFVWDDAFYMFDERALSERLLMQWEALQRGDLLPADQAAVQQEFDAGIDAYYGRYNQAPTWVGSPPNDSASAADAAALG